MVSKRMTIAPYLSILWLVAMLSGCANRVEPIRDPSEFDSAPKVTKVELRTARPLRQTYELVRDLTAKCFVKPFIMYAPMPVYIGDFYQTAEIDERAGSAQIVFGQKSIQSFLHYRVRFTAVNGEGTDVEIAVRGPFERTSGPTIVAWIKGEKKTCR